MAELYPNKKVSELTEEQKQTISALSSMTAGLAGAVAGNSGAGGAVGVVAGKTAVENNLLTKGEPALLAKKLSDCLAAGGSQAACQIAVQKEMNARSNANKEALGLAMQSGDQGGSAGTTGWQSG